MKKFSSFFYLGCCHLCPGIYSCRGFVRGNGLGLNWSPAVLELRVWAGRLNMLHWAMIHFVLPEIKPHLLFTEELVGWMGVIWLLSVWGSLNFGFFHETQMKEW